MVTDTEVIPTEDQYAAALHVLENHKDDLSTIAESLISKVIASFRDGQPMSSRDLEAAKQSIMRTVFPKPALRSTPE
ncbi:MAG: hypothetical protein AAF662_02895 [Pseudomonadota bacterium]